MANLKTLKNRIKSVKSTQKITKAMKFVAAVKLRRAKERMENGRYYLQAVQQIFASLLPELQNDNALRGFIAGNLNNKNIHVLVAMASDRGLCGPFNGYVIRNTKRQAEVLKAEGKKLLIITIGNKVTEALKNSEFAADIVASHTGIAKGLVGYQDAVKARSPKTADLLIQLDMEWAAVKTWQKKTLHLATLNL